MPIDIDRDAAREAAQHELAKSMYPKPSFVEQIIDWIQGLIYRLIATGSSITGGWFTVAVLLILVVIAVVVAIRIARRAMRSSRDDPQALFDTHVLSAAEHRATAERLAAGGDWASAIRHRVRALVRRLEENGVLDAVPGRTATELARAAGRALPAIADELAWAADTFNDVTYGERPGIEANYGRIAALDDKLGRHSSTSSGDAQQDAAQPWAEIR